ncbi:hypothetical protein CMQ_394 [Grosmannia clavigera kw1407]|uniref:Uncharacterized protein n=1 Tax=Grosmannia clavigera (strain kw1407 / UAMH 11150) TaxID=655863 RepID=F0XD84_GROCL|nr:uncharacterized protein CMQ_394 [Grosmannia clavigera kw1407]EFX03466.1 hypothetical protein CMQ_394 [Grosmannia clavigera kw1407]
MTEVICPLDARGIVAPLLPSLPSAAIASEPATAILPLLTPILRQRVQFLSASSSEPWIRLLSYDAVKAARLVEIARSTRLEPHPLSGEVEIDWDSAGAGNGGDVQIRYQRIDIETLQALVLLRDLDLVFRLVYCETDNEGGGSGWRVGEVSIPDTPDAFASFGGYQSAAEAERAFAGTGAGAGAGAATTKTSADQDTDDEDDDYWAQYDATPARTPAVKRSPAPLPTAAATSTQQSTETEADDAYFAQYDTVQPAMDSHDPDEDVGEPAIATPPIGFGRPTAVLTLERAVNGNTNGNDAGEDNERLANLIHPRPASASSQSSSSGSAAVAKLEHSADKRERGEFGVKQHVSRSIKSLFMLARASGIDREEFEQLVKTELDMLAMMEDD